LAEVRFLGVPVTQEFRFGNGFSEMLEDSVLKDFRSEDGCDLPLGIGLAAEVPGPEVLAS
jgi:hypothetical protein